MLFYLNFKMYINVGNQNKITFLYLLRLNKKRLIIILTSNPRKNPRRGIEPQATVTGGDPDHYTIEY